jgi:hypothetical protein
VWAVCGSMCLMVPLSVDVMFMCVLKYGAGTVCGYFIGMYVLYIRTILVYVIFL